MKYGKGKVGLPLQRDRNDNWMAKFPFGKYKGQTVKSIWKRDKGYCEWFAQNVTTKDAHDALSEIYLLGHSRNRSA